MRHDFTRRGRILDSLSSRVLAGAPLRRLERNSRRLAMVLVLVLIYMVAEVVGGLLSFVGGSLCLTMDAIARIVVVALHPLRVAAWRPPADLPLLAHYRPPIWGVLRTPGQGQYLHTELSELTFEAGLSWYGMLQVTRGKSGSSRSIYDAWSQGRIRPAIYH